MKRKTKIENISVPLTKNFTINAVKALRQLNIKLNEDILPIVINPDQIELQFITDEYGDDCTAWFEFER